MLNENQNLLEKAILKTLAFFDIFDYPLTLVEIYKWLYQPDKNYQLSDVSQFLDSENLKDKISDKNGFYFLKGRERIIQTRLERHQLAEKKFKIVLRTVKRLRWLVFVKMIAVCNTAGYNNAMAKSDIDFFIIIKSGRLWWSRLVIILLTQLLGLRRHNKKIANRICLSFYITEDHLNLSNIALPPADPYLVYWLATLAPIYDLNQANDFWQANNWLKGYLPNFYRPVLNNRRFVTDGWPRRIFKKINSRILTGPVGSWLEKVAEFIQLEKIKKNISSIASQPDTRVIIADDILKFHETDRREEYCLRWREKLKQLGIS